MIIRLNSQEPIQVELPDAFYLFGPCLLHMQYEMEGEVDVLVVRGIVETQKLVCFVNGI